MIRVQTSLLFSQKHHGLDNCPKARCNASSIAGTTDTVTEILYLYLITYYLYLIQWSLNGSWSTGLLFSACYMWNTNQFLNGSGVKRRLWWSKGQLTCQLTFLSSDGTRSCCSQFSHRLTHTDTHTDTHTCTHTQTRTHTYISIHTHTRTCTHTHTHIHFKFNTIFRQLFFSTFCNNPVKTAYNHTLHCQRQEPWIGLVSHKR